MYSGEIVDAHMHLWSLHNNHSWLNAPDPNLEKMLGDYGPLRSDFLATDYLQLAKENNITQSIAIEAFGCPDDSSKESEWLQEQADKYGIPNAIVGYAKLDDSNVEQLLKRHIQYKNMRGIRMVLNWHDSTHLRMTDRPDYMRDKKWLRGFSLLEKYDLTFDLQVFDHQLADAAELALAFPNVQIILEHFGWPLDFSATGFPIGKKIL